MGYEAPGIFTGRVFALILPGYIALPDLPNDTRVFWLSEKEKALGVRRMEDAGRSPDEPITMTGIKRVLSGWHFWVYTTYYTYLGPGPVGTAVRQ